MHSYDVATEIRSIYGGFNVVCGDAIWINENDQEYFFALFDGSGHGLKAQSVSELAVNYINNHHHLPYLEDILTGLHKHLQGTVGGVGALCRIIKKTGEISVGGVGNVRVRLVAERKKSMLTRGGVLGYEMAKPLVYNFTLEPEDILLIFSDGINEHGAYHKNRDIFIEPASSIAKEIIEVDSKQNDDASIIVIKVHDD